MGDDMLKLENISKFYYSSTSATCALRKINLEFNLGEFVAICGESGSGKTTLLNLISGFDSYEEGELYFNNKPTSYFDESDWEKYRKEEIAFIFQNYNLVESFSVLENVIVTYIIDGYSYKEAKIKAKEILKLVGLDKDIHKKAAKLSGGQKQRLSIARALAKETNIIIADEPTGNLDAENGEAILKLLKELSKDKLVIVVTHNLAQIEPFITRKVRLHDGEVVLNEYIEKKVDVKPVEKKAEAENNIKTVLNFSFLNIKSQPIRTILLFVLVLFMTLSTFVFFANFKANLDDSKTKKLTDDFFVNFDDTRILVKDKSIDGLNLDVLEKAKVEHVISVEKYDLITDINYYRPTDYKMVYGGGYPDPNSKNPNPGFVDMSSNVLVDHSHFMRSLYGIDESMLSAGRLPTGNFEMVVYSEDPNIIGTKELVFFRNDKMWGESGWYQYEVTIVGILSTPTEQAYFSDDICKMMELTSHKFSFYVYYYYYEYYRYNEKMLTYPRIAIDPTLKGDEISFDIDQFEGLRSEQVRLKESNNGLFAAGKDREYHTLKFNLSSPLTVCDATLGVSYELFEKIYSYYTDRTQFAVFIDDFAYTEDVIEDLSLLGFQALSCFKASITGYDTAKVVFRYINLLISVAALLIVNIVVVMIALSIMKANKNNFIIFKMIGLSNDLSRKITYLEVIVYGFISNILLIIIYLIINEQALNSDLASMLKYTKYYDFIIVFIITMLSMIGLGKKFSKYITQSGKITSLKEE